MSDNVSSSSSAAGAPELGPQSKIAIVPDASAGSSPNRNGHSVVEKAHSSPANGVEISPPAPAPPAEVAVVAANKTDLSKLVFNPISPGLTSVTLPLGPSPKEETKTVRILVFCVCIAGRLCQRCGSRHVVSSLKFKFSILSRFTMSIQPSNLLTLGLVRTTHTLHDVRCFSGDVLLL